MKCQLGKKRTRAYAVLQSAGAFNVLASSMNITGDADIQRHEAGLTGGAEDRLSTELLIG